MTLLETLLINHTLSIKRRILSFLITLSRTRTHYRFIRATHLSLQPITYSGCLYSIVYIHSENMCTVFTFLKIKAELQILLKTLFLVVVNSFNFENFTW